jgi:hypothetical protein
MKVEPSGPQLATSAFRSSDTSVNSERRKLLSGRDGILLMRLPAASSSPSASVGSSIVVSWRRVSDAENEYSDG